MSLRDRANSKVSHPGPQSCLFATWLDTLGEEDRAEVVECVRDYEVSAVGLAREVAATIGCPPSVNRQSIYRHRKGECVTCRPTFPKEST